MSDMDRIRGWKDRIGGPEAVEDHPAGDIDVTRNLYGGVQKASEGVFTWGCCDGDDSGWSCYSIC